MKCCVFFSGEGLEELVMDCSGLVELYVNGTELQDRFVMNFNWKHSRITKLEISWCRLLTSQGLRSMLNEMKYLEYLKVCSCGNGETLSDAVMHTIAASTVATSLKAVDFRYVRRGNQFS